MSISQIMPPVHQKDDCAINIQSFHVCLHHKNYTVYHTAYCGSYVHVHVASTVNGFGIWSTFGDTVLHVCFSKCHGHVCKSVVMSQ